MVKNKVQLCDGSSLLPEGFAVRVCVLKAHLLQFAPTVELIVACVSLLSQVLHVHSDQHFPEFNKVTVILIFHCGRHNAQHIKLLFNNIHKKSQNAREQG